GTVLEPATRVISRHPGTGEGEPGAHLVFLFSIATHLPPPMLVELSTWLTNVIEPGGLLVLTIRPREYWSYVAPQIGGGWARDFAASHDGAGFAYVPHGSGNEEYGDVSYTDDAIRSFFPQFGVVDRTFTVIDPLQIYYTMQRR